MPPKTNKRKTPEENSKSSISSIKKLLEKGNKKSKSTNLLYRQPTPRFAKGAYDGYEDAAIFVQECIDAFRKVSHIDCVALKTHPLFSQAYLERISTYNGETLLYIAFCNISSNAKCKQLLEILKEFPWSTTYLQNIDANIVMPPENNFQTNMLDNPECVKDYFPGIYSCVIKLYVSAEAIKREHLAKEICEFFYNAGYSCKNMPMNELETLFLFNQFGGHSDEHNALLATNKQTFTDSQEDLSTRYPNYPIFQYLHPSFRAVNKLGCIDYPHEMSEPVYKLRFDFTLYHEKASNIDVYEVTKLSYKQFYDCCTRYSIPLPNIIYKLQYPSAYHYLETKGQSIITARLQNGKTVLHVLCEHLFFPHLNYENTVIRLERNYIYYRFDNLYRGIDHIHADHTMMISLQCFQIITYFIAKGVDPDVKSKEGLFAWHSVKAQIEAFGAPPPGDRIINYREPLQDSRERLPDESAISYQHRMEMLGVLRAQEQSRYNKVYDDVFAHNVRNDRNLVQNRERWNTGLTMSAFYHAIQSLYLMTFLFPNGSEELEYLKNPSEGFKNMFAFVALCMYCPHLHFDKLCKQLQMNQAVLTWALRLHIKDEIGPCTPDEFANCFQVTRSVVCLWQTNVHNIYNSLSVHEQRKLTDPQQTDIVFSTVLAKVPMEKIETMHPAILHEYQVFFKVPSYWHFNIKMHIIYMQASALGVPPGLFMNKKYIISVYKFHQAKQNKEKMQECLAKINQLDKQCLEEGNRLQYQAAKQVFEDDNISKIIYKYTM